MGGSLSKAEFREGFGFHHALQLAISTAFRAGAPICLELLTATLMTAFPGSGMKEAWVRSAIIKAAKAANVPLRQGPAPARSIVAVASDRPAL